jgi:hypothetical protein
MLMIGEALKARAAVAEGGTGGAAAADCKLESLLKQCKLAIEVGNQLSIAHYKKMICMLEEKEAKEMEGGSLLLMSKRDAKDSDEPASPMSRR